MNNNKELEAKVFVVGGKMNILFLAAVFVPLVLSNPLFETPDGGKIWALLVAGSTEFWNYRHQVRIIIINKLFSFRDVILRLTNFIMKGQTLFLEKTL